MSGKGMKWPEVSSPTLTLMAVLDFKSTHRPPAVHSPWLLERCVPCIFGNPSFTDGCFRGYPRLLGDLMKEVQY